MSVRGHQGLYYFEGELPRPLAVSWVDEDGVLDASIAGATLEALTLIEGEASEVTVPMTNNGDGTMTIDWPTPSRFGAIVGQSAMMRVDIKVTEGSLAWYMDRFSIAVRKRM